MSARFPLTLAALLALAPVAAGASPVPAALKNLKPADIVEYVMAQRDFLALTDAQYVELGNISVAIRTEPHKWVHKGGKPHSTKHVRMTTKQQAWDQALAVLSAGQQERLASVVQVPAGKSGSEPVSRPKSKGGKR